MSSVNEPSTFDDFEIDFIWKSDFGMLIERVVLRLDLGNNALGPCGHFAPLHSKKFELDQELSQDLAQGGEIKSPPPVTQQWILAL